MPFITVLQNTESALGLKENSKVTVRFGMKIFAAGFHFCNFQNRSSKIDLSLIADHKNS